MTLVRHYLWNLLYALDQLVNAFLGGDPNETLSSRMGKAIQSGRCKLCRPVCWLLGRLDPDHCTKSIETVEVVGERSLDQG